MQARAGGHRARCGAGYEFDTCAETWARSSAMPRSFAHTGADCGAGAAGQLEQTASGGRDLPNPVPFSGQPITDIASCRDHQNTWFYECRWGSTRYKPL